MGARTDLACVQSLVAVLVAIHRRVDRGEQITRATEGRFPAATGESAPSNGGPGTAADASEPGRLASDGGGDRLATRDTDEGLLVVVDLRGVVRDGRETEVGVSEDSLVITIDERFAWRVPVESDPTSITGVSVNNDVLEVRVGLDR